MNDQLYKKMMDAVKKQVEDSYINGLKEGVRAFAWWKDGTQYVGTCGKTLKEAMNDIANARIQMTLEREG